MPHTHGSTIGIIRPSVTLCIVAFRIGVQGKSCTSVFLAGKFLFVRSDTFARKRKGKTSRRKRKRELF